MILTKNLSNKNIVALLFMEREAQTEKSERILTVGFWTFFDSTRHTILYEEAHRALKLERREDLHFLLRDKAAKVEYSTNIHNYKIANKTVTKTRGWVTQIDVVPSSIQENSHPSQSRRITWEDWSIIFSQLKNITQAPEHNVSIPKWANHMLHQVVNVARMRSDPNFQ